jgi:hypothetical protein
MPQTGSVDFSPLVLIVGVAAALDLLAALPPWDIE